jgi:hypothetical protein
MPMPFKRKKVEPGPPKKEPGRPRKSPETPAVKLPRPMQTRFRGKAKPNSEALFKTMEKFNKIAMNCFFKLGGEDLLLKELQKEDDSYVRAFLRELFSINKKYYDVLIAKMRIEAEQAANGAQFGERRGN